MNIYYCWFGNTELPNNTQKYLKSWNVFFPNAKIIEINETNFDISEYLYAQTAYEQKKYAFVSDVARIHFLEHHGGIYFDTDVEVVADFAFLEADTVDIVLSMEYYSWEVTGVNTATIISKPKQQLWQDLLTFYKQTAFDMATEPATINMHINELLERKTNFVYKDKQQAVQYDQHHIRIVPSTFLMRKGKQTAAIHHLEGSWTAKLSFKRKVRRYVGLVLKKIIGRRAFNKLWKK